MASEMEERARALMIDLSHRGFVSRSDYDDSAKIAAHEIAAFAREEVARAIEQLAVDVEIGTATAGWLRARDRRSVRKVKTVMANVGRMDSGGSDEVVREIADAIH